MGVQVAGRCLADIAEAAAATCANVGYVVQPVSGGAQSTECAAVQNPVNGLLSIRTAFLANGGTSWTATSKNYTPAYLPCSVLGWEEGLALGWAVVIAWIGAVGVTYMAKGR